MNIGEKLAAASIADLDPAAWPASAFVDHLRDEVTRLSLTVVLAHLVAEFSQVDNLKKKGIAKPFVYIELHKKCLPAWALVREEGLFS